MRFRFHRSLVFWFGLFVLIFLCWSAIDSARYLSKWSLCRNGMDVWSINTGFSRVIFARTRMIDTDPLAIHTYAVTSPYGRLERYTSDPAKSPTPFPLWSVSQEAPFSSYQLLIHRLVLPYGLIIPVYIALWGAMLALRWRSANKRQAIRT